MQRQRSYLRDVRSRLPYALVLGLLVLILVWWLDDLQSAIGLALGGLIASALTLPFTLPEVNAARGAAVPEWATRARCMSTAPGPLRTRQTSWRRGSHYSAERSACGTR